MYKLSQEQEILRETIREFAESEISPLAAAIDRDCEVPGALVSKLPRLGLFGITVDPELGGAGADFLSLVVAIEEVSRVSGSLGAQLSAHNGIVCEALSLSENSALKRELLAKLVSAALGAFVFYSTSSDAGRLTARFGGNALVLNGSAGFVLNAAVAEVFLVRAWVEGSEDDFALLAFPKSKLAHSGGALRVGPMKRLMGMRGAATAGLVLRDLKVPVESLLCDVARSAQLFDRLRARSRLAVAAQALGIGQAALDSSLKFANERSQFNTKIGKFYAVQDMLASDVAAVESARAITYQAAAAESASADIVSRDSAVAKLCASNAAVSACRHAIRIHGGYGFTRDYPVERYMRDARVTQIYFESNEALKSDIAKSALGLKA